MSRSRYLRTCIGCSQKFPRTQLLRLVLRGRDELIIDEEGTAHGRGCHLCKNRRCAVQAIRRRGLHKTYSRPVAASCYTTLENYAQEYFAS